jgi:hypothetical protein
MKNKFVTKNKNNFLEAIWISRMPLPRFLIEIQAAKRLLTKSAVEFTRLSGFPI